MQNHQITIIGAGPAGIAAGIQLKRYGLDPVIFEPGNIGGLLLNANLVENYPGFPNGIPGPILVELFRKQIENLSLDIRKERVLNLDYRNDSFLIVTDQEIHISEYVVIASGTNAKTLRLSVSDPTLFEHILYEVYYIKDVKDKEIAVIGGGDAAFDYALNLSKRNNITILNRSDNVKCLQLLWERVLTKKKIKYVPNIEVKSIEDADGRMTLNLLSKDMVNSTLTIDYLLIAVGRNSASSFLLNDLKKAEEYLVSNGRLHYVGDVRNENYRQVSIAVGDGIKAAMKIYDSINLHL